MVILGKKDKDWQLGVGSGQLGVEISDCGFWNAEMSAKGRPCHE